MYHERRGKARHNHYQRQTDVLGKIPDRQIGPSRDAERLVISFILNLMSKFILTLRLAQSTGKKAIEVQTREPMGQYSR